MRMRVCIYVVLKLNLCVPRLPPRRRYGWTLCAEFVMGSARDPVTAVGHGRSNVSRVRVCFSTLVSCTPMHTHKYMHTHTFSEILYVLELNGEGVGKG